ncbi:BLUF domain-containing protein [Cryobacterium sp. PH31-O1]|uniref:BLUF domain-containing protein n=1 Tax=Cryobacterium sp. PH31-O1 TaxID=3046306 RepID=UPI0024BB41E6|nr:BLUF domain-containing protein [Cryobacterium sp. PH31-O1]MDJ0338370.1 BLUF domain-containing protein [Cryobacterium sp. PH31-O1]
MLSIAYVSAAATAMSDDDIAAILVQARANNVAHQLTGALIYHDRKFIQILEGPEQEVRSRLRAITADPRHRSIHMVSEESITERQFPQWTMGFRPLSDPAVKHLAGYDDIFDGSTGEVHLERGTDQAQALLEWLARYWFSPVA